mmetsp:Transcript_6741/g.23903  ORF Transcript_6741/g.23903 Transcript_6741/m.23903 type:complete len:130 (+) Transcript_6741:1705-2094(+)
MLRSYRWFAPHSVGYLSREEGQLGEAKPTVDLRNTATAGSKPLLRMTNWKKDDERSDPLPLPPGDFPPLQRRLGRYRGTCEGIPRQRIALVSPLHALPQLVANKAATSVASRQLRPLRHPHELDKRAAD